MSEVPLYTLHPGTDTLHPAAPVISCFTLPLPRNEGTLQGVEDFYLRAMASIRS